MIRIADVWKLQETDSALDTRSASLDDARGRLGEPEELVAARNTLEELRRARQSAQATQKDVEMEADALRAKIAPAEERLYAGSIRNPKELADLQADIEQLRRHLSAIEDRDLAALVELETAETAFRQAEAALQAQEAAHREDQRELEDRIARLAVEIQQYEAQRRDVAAAIDASLLRVYDHVRRAHQGKGVSRLDRNLCTGCRITLPTTTVNKARGGTALVQCPNCERILYA